MFLNHVKIETGKRWLMVDGYLASSHPSPPISNPRNLRKGLFQLESKGGGRTSISGIANFEFTLRLRGRVFFFFFSSSHSLFPWTWTSSTLPPSLLFFPPPPPPPDSIRNEKAYPRSDKVDKVLEKLCAKQGVRNWIITSNGVMDHATPRVKGRKLFKPWNVTRNFILNRTNLAPTIFPNNASVESCNWFKWHAQEESV